MRDARRPAILIIMSRTEVRVDEETRILFRVRDDRPHDLCTQLGASIDPCVRAVGQLGVVHLEGLVTLREAGKVALHVCVRVFMSR